MKLTFEGTNMRDVVEDMELALDFLRGYNGNIMGRSKINPAAMPEKPKATAIPTNGSGQGPGPEEPEQEDFFEPPKKAVKKPKAVQEPEQPVPVELTPAEKVKLRQSTVEDLQKAFGSGKQKEVLELLSKYGGGAKSFRELPIEAFIPIREAIDAGALA